MPVQVTFPLPTSITKLRAAHQDLVHHYAHTGLTFTLDGKLVGDIGEAIALEYFDIEQPRDARGEFKRIKGIDAVVCGTRKTVQVKATGKPKTGPAFSRGEAVADLLLFLRIDWEAGAATVLYNGPEAPIRSCLRSSTEKGTVSVRLAAVLKVAKTITDQRLQVPRKQSARLAA